MPDTVFLLRGLGKVRPGNEGFRLRIARLDVLRGSLLALAGPSGCGKSTALDMLACVLRPDTDTLAASSGEDADAAFLFRPADANKVTDVLTAWRRGGIDALARLRLHHLGYVLQTGGLLPFLSAHDNILMRCKSLGIAIQRQDAVQTVVERLGIAHLLRQYPATLSVGERQRVAIAGALAHGPSVVLADEPTAALDPCHAANVLHLFAELAQSLGITVIMVTHNLDQAREAGFTLAQVTTEQGAQGITATIDWAQEEA